MSDAHSDRDEGTDPPAVPRFEPSAESQLLVALDAVSLSGAVSGTAAVLAAVLVGQALVGATLTVVALVAGGGLAVGLYALDSDSLRTLLLGGVVLTPAAALLAGSLGVGVGYGVRTQSAVGFLAAVVVLLLVIAGFAAVLTAVPAGEAQVLAGAFSRFVGMLVPLTVAQVFALVIAAGESAVGVLAGLVVDSPEPLLVVARVFLAPEGSAALLTFLLYVVLLVALLRSMVSSLPLATLFPPRRRPSVTDRIDAARRALSRLLFLAVLGSCVVYAAALVTGTLDPAALAGALGPVSGGAAAWLLTTVWLRVAVVLVIGMLVAVLVAERVRRRLRRRSEADILRQVLPAAGAVLAALVVGLALDVAVSRGRLLSSFPASVRPAAEPLLSGGVVAATMTVVFASLILVASLFVLLMLLAGSPVLSERALGPALAGGVTFALALLLVLFAGSPLVAFVAGALALVAWDTGEYATGLREDLPAGATTVRGELVHAGGSFGVAAAAVTGAFGLELLVAGDLVVPAVSDTTLAAGALALAFATTVVLLSSLRE